MEKARTLMLAPAQRDDTFSPVREKVSKERTFVRSGLTPYKSEIGTVGKVSIGALSSGGIIALFAQMWIVKYRWLSCASLHRDW